MAEETGQPNGQQPDWDNMSPEEVRMKALAMASEKKRAALETAQKAAQRAHEQRLIAEQHAAQEERLRKVRELLREKTDGHRITRKVAEEVAGRFNRSHPGNPINWQTVILIAEQNPVVPVTSDTSPTRHPRPHYTNRAPVAAFCR